MSQLAAQALTLRYGTRAVLRDVSLTLQAGQLTVLLGPNGAGKSTLLRALAGLQAAEAGRVLLAGGDLAALPPARRAQQIGYLPQRPDCAWALRLADMVALGRLPWRDRDAGAVAAALALCDLTDKAERSVHSLSGGEFMRGMLAQLFAGRPRFLLLDEPLAGLDPAHQFALLAQLKTQAEAGAAVLLALHDLPLAFRMADRVVVLQDGRVVAQGAPPDALTPALIETVFAVTARIEPGEQGPMLLLDRKTG